MEEQIAGNLTVDPPRPSRQRSGIPTGFDDVIARGMAKNPDARYQSAHDLPAAALPAFASRTMWRWTAAAMSTSSTTKTTGC